MQVATRRYPGCEWIAANADRSYRAPIIPSALSYRSPCGRIRRSSSEFCASTGAPPGGFALACGSCRDTRCGRDRVARTVATFAHEFTLIAKRRVSTSADFDAAPLNDVLLSIYRPMRSQPTRAKCVTFSLDLPLFQA